MVENAFGRNRRRAERLEAHRLRRPRSVFKLYALDEKLRQTIVAIFAGWLVVSTSPLPVPTQFFGLFVIQNIARPDAALFSAATLAHEVAAWSIAGLVALHAAGALKHHFVDSDDVLLRMLPRWPFYRNRMDKPSS